MSVESAHRRRSSPVALALAVLADRIAEASPEDLTDMQEMGRLFMGDPDPEEREAAARAIAEILDPPAGRLLALDEWQERAPGVNGEPS